MLSRNPTYTNIFYANANDFSCKIDEVLSKMTKNTLILSIVETWYRTSDPDPFQFVNSGFKIFRNDRKKCDRKGCGAGGCMLAVHSSIPSKLISKFDAHLIEALVVEIEISNKKFMIASIYRSPDANDEDTLQLFQFLSSF